VTLLAGNHELVLLGALDSGDMVPFLKMGGATTIRSYLGRPVRPDVRADFRAHLPEEHVDCLRSMPTRWESDDVVAQHAPFAEPSRKFQVSAHVPVGILPRITADSAQLDTGGGDSDGTGRLTAFLWPSRDFIQVDARGVPVPGGR
jgi:serine/threonine protein phosphatase 1